MPSTTTSPTAAVTQWCRDRGIHPTAYSLDRKTGAMTVGLRNLDELERIAWESRPAHILTSPSGDQSWCDVTVAGVQVVFEVVAVRAARAES